MKKFVAAILISVLAVGGLAQLPLSNTNTAWRSPTYAPTALSPYYVTLWNSNAVVPFKMISVPMPAFFSNVTAFGSRNWPTQAVLNACSVNATNLRVDNTLFVQGNINFQSGGPYMYGSAAEGIYVSDLPGAPVPLVFGFTKTHIIVADVQGFTFKQRNSGETLIPTRQSRVQVGGMDGVWFTSAAASNATATTTAYIGGIKALFGTTNWLQVAGATNGLGGDGNLRVDGTLGSTTITNGGNFTNGGSVYVTGSVIVNSALAVTGTAGIVGGVNSSFQRGVAMNGVAVGASPFNWTNTSVGNVTMYIGGGTLSQVNINGSDVFATGVTNAVTTIMVQSSEYLTVTYSVAPTMRWKAF